MKAAMPSNNKATADDVPTAQNGIGTIVPPTDALRELIPEETRRKWRKKGGAQLIERIQVLESSGPLPSDECEQQRMWQLRAQKAAWEMYLSTAYSCSLFCADRAADLVARLRSPDESDFRSAIAECLACWFFAGKLRLPFGPNCKGRGAKTLDMKIWLNSTAIGVEVKAPFAARPASGGWFGDESEKIQQAIDSANRQFCDGSPNILVLVPELRRAIFQSRDDLVKACYGQRVIAGELNTSTGQIENVRSEFLRDGRLLNTALPSGKRLKPDGLPGGRRISSIICIEQLLARRDDFYFSSASSLGDNLAIIAREAARERPESWIEHSVLVAHNPWAHYPIGPTHFSQFPQFARTTDSEMRWTDSPAK
jgi:hypothetical protein